MRPRSAPFFVLVLLLAAMPPAVANPAERFASARELMHDGQLDAALAAIETLRAEYPNDVDYAFARAQALIRLGRESEAADELDTAIAMAPDYEDIWRTRYGLLTSQDDSAEVETFRSRAADQFPASNWWRIAGPASPAAWMLLVGAGADSLSNDLPGWDNQFIEAHYEYGETARYMSRLSRDARNSIGDLTLALAGEWQFRPWFTGASVAVTADPEFQASTGFELHAGRTFGEGWSATLRYRHRDYDNATIGTVVTGIEKYVSDFRVAYTLGASRLHGASNFANHVVTGNWFYREDSSIGVSLSGGREAEAIGGGRVIETDVRGISLTGRHRLNERLGLHWWLGVHEQGDLYRRRFVGMAVSVKL